MAGKSPLKARLGRASPSFRLHSPSLNTVRLRRVFDLSDRNGDGEISIEEIWGALDRLGLGADPTDLADLVAPHIRPGHAGLTFDDFVGLHGTLSDALDAVGRAGEEADMMEAFNVFDEDGDGFISAKELQAVLGKLGLLEGESMDRINQMIGSVDSNHDSRVDFHEFKNMMVGITVKSA